MALDPRPRPPVLRAVVTAALLGVLIVYLAMPDVAGAALQSAAGGKPGSGGFARFVPAEPAPTGHLVSGRFAGSLHRAGD